MTLLRLLRALWGVDPTGDYGRTPPAENGSSREMDFVACSEFLFLVKAENAASRLGDHLFFVRANDADRNPASRR